MNPTEKELYRLAFKGLMAKFLESFKGQGLSEKTLCKPLSYSTTLDENQPRHVIVVNRLEKFGDFFTASSRN